MILTPASMAISSVRSPPGVCKNNGTSLTFGTAPEQSNDNLDEVYYIRISSLYWGLEGINPSNVFYLTLTELDEGSLFAPNSVCETAQPIFPLVRRFYRQHRYGGAGHLVLPVP